VSPAGDFGKLRPALVVQSDRFAGTGTVTVVLITGTLIDAPLLRIPVEPTPSNGLRVRSQVMVDKVMSVRRDKVGPVFGHMEEETLIATTRSLAVFLGFA